MSTANQPTVTCLLDDGTGTFPRDVSAKVSLSNIEWGNVGRVDESTTANPATLNLDLNNNDGTFTTTPVTKGQPIRFKLHTGATTRTCFTGRVESVTQSWQGAPGKRSTISVSAVDSFAELARRPMRSMLEQEILLDSPTAYYTLGEPEGSQSAGDTSGNSGTSLTITGSGPALAFGAGTGPVDGLTAVEFNSSGLSASPTQYLSAAPPATTYTTGGSWSMEAFLNWTGTGSNAGVQLTSSGSALGVGVLVNSTGAEFTLNAFDASATATSGATHHLVMTFDGTNVKGYLDGALAVSGTATCTDSWQILNVGLNSTGTISHVAIYDGIVLSATRVAAHAAVLTGFEEDTAARFTRIASYAGMSTSTPANSGQLVGSQDTTGQSILDALTTVSDTEGGVMFVDGDGTLVMQGRNYRTLRTTVDLALTGKALDPNSTNVVDDTQQKINQATVTRTGGATQVYQDDASIADDGVFPTSLDLIIDTDDHALEHAQWVVNKHVDPGARMASVTFDNLLTSAQAANLLALDIGDRLSFSAMPSQVLANLGDVTIEGWSMTISDIGSPSAAWSMTANLLPWALFSAALYDDAGSLYDTAGDVYAY